MFDIFKTEKEKREEFEKLLDKDEEKYGKAQSSDNPEFLQIKMFVVSLSDPTDMESSLKKMNAYLAKLELNERIVEYDVETYTTAEKIVFVINVTITEN